MRPRTYTVSSGSRLRWLSARSEPGVGLSWAVWGSGVLAPALELRAYGSIAALQAALDSGPKLPNGCLSMPGRAARPTSRWGHTARSVCAQATAGALG